MKFSILIKASLLFAVLGSAASEAQTRYGTAGTWSIVKYGSTGCVAKIANIDGAVLALRRSPNKVVGLFFQYNRLSIPPGRYPYEAEIGGARLAIRKINLTLAVSSEDSTYGVSIIDESTVDLFKYASWFALKLGSKRYHFDFDGTSDALNMSMICENSMTDPFAIRGMPR